LTAPGFAEIVAQTAANARQKAPGNAAK